MIYLSPSRGRGAFDIGRLERILIAMNLTRVKHVLQKTSLLQLKRDVEILTVVRKCSTAPRKEDKERVENKSIAADNPETDELLEPTTCCMSGCANCVWIQYAEKLSKSLANSDEDVQRIIMEKVQDANMRAFLSLELRCRKLVQ